MIVLSFPLKMMVRPIVHARAYRIYVSKKYLLYAQYRKLGSIVDMQYMASTFSAPAFSTPAFSAPAFSAPVIQYLN